MKKLTVLIATLVFVTGFCTLDADAQSHGCTDPLNRNPSPGNGYTSLPVPSPPGTQEFSDQTYTVTGCMDHVPREGLPIVFAFHGGGECVYDGDPDCSGKTSFLNFSHLWELNALVVAPSGNKSFNGTSWSNAFPWMEKTVPLGAPVRPANDLDLPDIIIADIQAKLGGLLPPINFSGKYYAVGKSDGAGMAMALACSPQTQTHVLGVGLVSGAYFGLGSATNFTDGDHPICLPNASIPVIIMHATKDMVMIYHGQNFLNAKALTDASKPNAYWPTIDPGSPDSCCRNTFTADVPAYVQAIADNHHCNGPQLPQNVSKDPDHPIDLTSYDCPAPSPVSFVAVPGGNHCWFGYEHSGPSDCNSDPNVDYSATKGIADFLSIVWGN